MTTRRERKSRRLLSYFKKISKALLIRTILNVSHHLHPWAKNCSMKDHQLTISNLILKDIAPILGAHRAPYFADFWWICSLLNLCRRGFNAIQLLGKMSHPRGVPPRKPQGQKIYLRYSAVHLCISTSVKRNQKSKF